jgi:hypothetical protein
MLRHVGGTSQVSLSTGAGGGVALAVPGAVGAAMLAGLAGAEEGAARDAGSSGAPREHPLASAATTSAEAKPARREAPGGRVPSPGGGVEIVTVLSMRSVPRGRKARRHG